MYNYTFAQWLLFFYIYCFIGWIIESTIVSISEKKFVNRGFLRVPMLPLYGFGALTMLFSTLFVRNNPTLVFLFGAISATALEYVTGVIMESLFNVKYWDYSKMDFNFKGRICLMSSSFWGFLSLLLIYQIHSFVEGISVHISEQTTIIIVSAISIIFVADVFYSVRTAFNIKSILEKMTKLKDEMELLIAEKVESSERATAILEKVEALKAERQQLFSKMKFYARELIKAHPRATSTKFSKALEELKSTFKSKTHHDNSTDITTDDATDTVENI